MKTALIITNEKTNDVETYNCVEFSKALKARGYTVRHFDASLATSVDRAALSSANFDFAILASRLFSFTGSAVPSNYKANLEVIKGLDTVFVNDLEPHINTCNKWLVYKRLTNWAPIPKTVIVQLDSSTKDNDGSTLYSQVQISTLTDEIDQVGGYPFVYKRIYGAEGEHVHIVRSEAEFRALLDSERSGPQYFIIQEYIKDAEAIMLCVRIVEDQVITRMFLGSPYGTRTFKSYTAPGRQQLPCVTTEEIRQVAQSTIKALDLDTARIDMFLTSEGIKVCEVNSIGSLLPTDQTHNMHVAELIVDLAIKKLEKKRAQTADD